MACGGVKHTGYKEEDSLIKSLSIIIKLLLLVSQFSYDGGVQKLKEITRERIII